MLSAVALAALASWGLDFYLMRCEDYSVRK